MRLIKHLSLMNKGSCNAAGLEKTRREMHKSQNHDVGCRKCEWHLLGSPELSVSFTWHHVTAAQDYAKTMTNITLEQ